MGWSQTQITALFTNLATLQRAPPLCHWLGPNGKLVLPRLLTEQLDSTAAVYGAYAQETQRMEQNGWGLLEYRAIDGIISPP